MLFDDVLKSEGKSIKKRGGRKRKLGSRERIKD